MKGCQTSISFDDLLALIRGWPSLPRPELTARCWRQIIGPDDLVDGFTPDRLSTLLRDVFTAAGGTHDDWDEYDRVMAEDRRAAVIVNPERITSNQGS